MSDNLQHHLEVLDTDRQKVVTDLQTQLKTYAESQQQQLAAHAESILPQLLAGVVHKQLTADEQHELVMNQLKQAWEEGLIKV